MRDSVDETLEFLQSLEATCTSSNDQLVPPGERECPICKEKMNAEVVEGVTLDSCQQHGVWLDFGELEAITTRIRRGQRINRAYAVKRAREEGLRTNNAMAGLLAMSLMFSD